jgi:hypothetical protein
MNAEEFLTATSLDNYLLRLHENTLPEWGKMNAVQMLEHLGLAMAFSCNKHGVLPILTPPEKIDRYKQFLYSDMEMLRSLPSPMQGEVPPVPHSSNLIIARQYLLDEISDFDDYFRQHPGEKTVHHIFGMLDYEEWKAFHRKHFLHHFRQFGML